MDVARDGIASYSHIPNKSNVRVWTGIVECTPLLPLDDDGVWELEEELQVEAAMGLGRVTVAAATTWGTLQHALLS